jgi:hypothetical protein
MPQRLVLSLLEPNASVRMDALGGRVRGVLALPFFAGVGACRHADM